MLWPRTWVLLALSVLFLGRALIALPVRRKPAWILSEAATCETPREILGHGLLCEPMPGAYTRLAPRRLLLAQLRVDLNQASREELLVLDGIGEVLADRILAHRPFCQPQDLYRVPGLGKARAKALLEWVQMGCYSGIARPQMGWPKK